MPSGSQVRNRHYQPDEKCAAVRRLLRGEDANRIAADLQISAERLARWERIFLEGGRKSLAEHKRRRSRPVARMRALAALTWIALFLLLMAVVYAASRTTRTVSQPEHTHAQPITR
jgi:transposase-like protein